MTPNSSSSPDGSAIPPRHRPNLNSLSKVTTEEQLWDFDGAESAGARPPEDAPPPPTIPRPRDEQHVKPHPLAPPTYPRMPEFSAGQSLIKVNVGKNGKKTRDTTRFNALPTLDSEFDDLDSWDDSELSPLVADLAPVASPVVPAPAPAPVANAAATTADERDEFSATRVAENTRPAVLPQLGLSKIERIGLLALLALLIIGGGIVFLNSVSRLPSEADLMPSLKFPIKGERVTIEAAQSFWRVPVADIDTFRRGTEVLPVASLTVRGGPAALRVFFRDSDGQVVGDAVNHSVSDAGRFEVSATAGFEEAWMHDTYQTARGKPWTIEVLEGPSQGAPAGDFKTLFTMKISADRR